MLNKYLSYIQEGRVISSNANAPCAAYETVYNKKCPNLRGRINSEERLWHGIYVDVNIQDQWLNDLAKIKQIETRSSCEGHGPERVTFLIFRLTNTKLESDKKYLTKLVLNLERSDKLTKASWSIGRGEGRPRIIVAAPTWFGQPDWEQWWTTLAKRVKRSL